MPIVMNRKFVFNKPQNIDFDSIYSTMAISLLNSISDFLESGVDECTTNLFDWTTNDISGSDEGEGDSDDDHDTSQRRSKSTNSLRYGIMQTGHL